MVQIIKVHAALDYKLKEFGRPNLTRLPEVLLVCVQ